MPKVKVYFFEGYDIVNDRVVRSKRAAIPGAIEALGYFHRLDETETEVDSADLDGEGFVKKRGLRFLR